MSKILVLGAFLLMGVAMLLPLRHTSPAPKHPLEITYTYIPEIQECQQTLHWSNGETETRPIVCQTALHILGK